MSRDHSLRAEQVLARVRASADPAFGIDERVLARVEQRIALDAGSTPAAEMGGGFDATRAAMEATKALAAMAKQWPKDEPTAPLIEAVTAWLGTLASNPAASKTGAA